ncbi:Protein kinase superfamily protein [Abeliophyllum distichum]|uniref:Protein kinase superfamily protein n=1 Tax=Abeliophyllum distichum TaxID=126358 RepID=A0ABD1W1E4_9LAMI
MHRRNSETDHGGRSRNDPGNASSKSNPPETDGENLGREDNNKDEYQEMIAMQVAEQEEDELERIREESRKQRQAILEKYKNQSLQQQDGTHSKDIVKEHDQVAAADVPENFEGHAENEDAYVANPSFSIGKSPSQNGLSAFERVPGTGGLGKGTPQSETSDDMFYDDIFGESPAGIRRKGKEGLGVERSGLHDNWDEAEGCYGYLFGEILDGRYKVIAAHGKGVFSAVVRAKDLKAKPGDHEEVAIKIIRNNETMYKTGMEELIVLKKLVGADPEDKRHCVRYLSNFKYRNHLCLVLESLHMNLREVLKKFGRNIGLKLTAVRAYSKQLFIALKHLKKLWSSF